MRKFHGAWLVLAGYGILGVPLAPGADSRVEPVANSVHPFTLRQGSEVTATVRGSGLRGATAAFVSGAPIRITVEGVEPGASPDVKTPKDLVKLRVKAEADAKPGRYAFRLITPYGVSNVLTLLVTDLAVTAEPEQAHETPESAVAVSSVPVVIAGRLARRGETDFYAFHAKSGQTLTFEAISGLPQIAAGGSAATIPNFDPAISIYEASGSWFDDRRLKRIAYNDEPEWVVGRITDAHLTHRFAHDGSYFLRVEAFAGQGGPDYSYLLRILPGDVPEDLPKPRKEWDERGFSRSLPSDRLNRLASRGGGKTDQPSIETYRASADPANVPVFKLPGTLEGTLAAAGETHRARFQLDGPRDLAIELETPGAAPPFFNPVVRLLNASGEEVASNLFAGRGACNGALTKSLQAKTLLPLREAGAYTLEIRDATADLAGPDFRYRVLVRPQVPHVGQVAVELDHLNLAQDEAKTIRVTFDREEDYRGAVAVTAESLPPGVQAVTGADYEPEKDPPPSTGKRERYTPRTERAVLILSAARDAVPTAQPQMARIVVRPLVNGKLGDILTTKNLPLMVIAKP